jgi:hypothetical protein
VLSYGSDTSFVGKTLLQANEFFGNGCLSAHVDTKKALELTLNFLKEVVPLYEAMKSYTDEEAELNRSFSGKTEEDGTLKLPQINNLERQVKSFISNTDHAMKHLIGLAQLFYPSLPSKQWVVKLHDEIKKQRGKKEPALAFVSAITPFIHQMRNMRSAIEHLKPDNQISTHNYRLNENGKVAPPSVEYNGAETPLSSASVSSFMTEVFDTTLIAFEVLMAYLCNIHAEPFAGDARFIVEIPETERRESEKHVRFRYEIAWSK